MKPLKGQTTAFFGEGCRNCVKRNDCMAATSVSSDLRRYLLKVRGQRQKSNPAMTEGTRLHKERQKGIPTLNEMGLKKFQKNILKGKHVQISEAMICAPSVGLRGFVDILDIEFTKEGKFKIKLNELKSGVWHKHYIFQMAAYGMMFSSADCRIHYQKQGKKRMKNIPVRLYPHSKFELDIDAIIEFIPRGYQMDFPFMRDGIVLDSMKGIVIATQNRMKERRKFHNTGLYYLDQTPPCGWCKQDDKFCSLWGKVCSKINYEEIRKTKQRYWGKSKTLVQTKPKGVIKRR